MSDRILGGICVALAAFYIWGATQIQLSFISDPVGPRTFPIIIAVLVGLSGLAIMLRPDPEPEWPAMGRFLEIAAAVVVLVAYAQVLPELGFVISTAFAAGFLSWRLGAGPIQATIAGILIAVGIYVVFHLILGLSLARGPFGF
ncbi:MAG: tripartite tricarboxylate transporter TctB family protein [Alphaproteobacteria bacterium]|nr:tripartite tricarboxylate transporter TctB family protein [Alphaproteobacteria bacterium]MBU0802162.1 tripartite tricarboxylate transporter TctB family protein [Alphaproteobacteria bacterium]MBU0872232.1 tripartite tricarboxylate transporter TctB family protein [Alphaproteobacteria bacterium]MBU1399661.1 tripartite tricarboxylate transporter TctB family protein [Alphaproteobacteria bacterium]MBU1590047.1 tripartite tricarboxylate transporter TctB family protein [Alphaproteobacteria bacterium